MKVLAQIVATQMGGQASSEKSLINKWIRSSRKLKRKYKSVVIPIGKLRTGLSRHRALLYKVIADAMNIRCRLARGWPYGSSSAQAVNLVMFEGTELIVDLVIQPGRLIRAEGYNPEGTGINEIFAEAPGMPSCLYWQPPPQKVKNHLLYSEGGIMREGSQKSSGSGNVGQFSRAIANDLSIDKPIGNLDNQSPFAAPGIQQNYVETNNICYPTSNIPHANSSGVSISWSNTSHPGNLLPAASGTSIVSGSTGWEEESPTPEKDSSENGRVFPNEDSSNSKIEYSHEHIHTNLVNIMNNVKRIQINMSENSISSAKPEQTNFPECHTSVDDLTNMEDTRSTSSADIIQNNKSRINDKLV